VRWNIAILPMEARSRSGLSRDALRGGTEERKFWPLVGDKNTAARAADVTYPPVGVRKERVLLKDCNCSHGVTRVSCAGIVARSHR
jgi:hypothetical protein